MPLPTVAPWSPTACRFTEQQKPRVLVSLAAVGLFMAVGWPLIVYYTGWWGLVKFWLMPWLGYHFWVSAWGRWAVSKGQLNSSVVDAYKQSYIGSETHQGSAMAHIFLSSAV